MKNILTLWRKELGAFFLSPTAYVIQAVFLALSGLVFLQMVEGAEETSESVECLFFKALTLFWIPILAPLVSMRTFAEETRSGTLETLLTAPVTDTEAVLGKFAGAWSFMMAIILPAAAFPFMLRWIGPELAAVDGGAMAGGCLLAILVCAFFTAVGVWISLLTTNQVVAAVCGLAAIIAWLLAAHGVRAFPTPAAAAVADYLSMRDHVVEAARGLLDTRPIALYVTGTAFFLFVAVRTLESRKWR